MTVGLMTGGGGIVFATTLLAADVVNKEITLKRAIRKLLFCTSLDLRDIIFEF